MMRLSGLPQLIVVSLLPVLAFGADLQLEYFSDAMITCHFPHDDHHSIVGNSTDSSAVTGHIERLIWLLPSDKLILPAISSDSKYLRSDNNNLSTLTIRKIDDVDFGTYTCIFVWNDFNITIETNTLNKDGASMEMFLAQQQRNAVIGGIAAGVMLLVLLIAYVIWRFTCSERVRRKRRLTNDLAKGVNRYSTEFYDNIGFEHYVKKSDVK